MADDAYIEHASGLIRAWKAEEPGVVSRALGQVLQPLTWAVQQLIPEAAIRGVIDGLDWVAKNSTTAQGSHDLNDLAGCDSSADSVINFHIAGAAAEGGAAGFFGIVTLPADIPAVILMALRLIRQVGIEYGYAEDNDQERAFARSVLAAAGANSQAEKIEALGVASMVLNKLTRETWKAMAAKAAAQPVGLEAAIIGTRNLAKSLGINLTKRKALAAVPVIGAAVGASANGWYMREVGVAAQRSFQERWLRDRDLIYDDESGASEWQRQPHEEESSAESSPSHGASAMVPLMTGGMYERFQALRDRVAEADGDAAMVFVPVAPASSHRNGPRILFIAQATRGWSEEHVSTFEGAWRTAEYLVHNPLSRSAFWQVTKQITREVMSAIDSPYEGDLAGIAGWSNLLKIGHPDRNPREGSWAAQAELCIEQLRYEIETMRPTAVVLMTRNFAQREIVEPLFGRDGWQADTPEEDRVAWKTSPTTVVWMNHPRNMGQHGYRAASVAKAVELVSAAYRSGRE